jgi:hypothetical protein
MADLGAVNSLELNNYLMGELHLEERLNDKNYLKNLHHNEVAGALTKATD